ncbi:hypothetical protein TI05_07030 [Achromatium sp. WMS3]|nr:hypothetical protein TI05_07030 [Achromatium sp. WMS3]
MNLQVIESLVSQAEKLTIEERLALIEQLIKKIRLFPAPIKLQISANVEQICGILEAPHSVSLEQMDQAIKKRGSKL